jgi:hypothetical protein
MVHRFLLTGAILLFVLLFVPGCGGSPTTTSTRGALPPDQPPPEPKPGGGRSG